MVLIELCLVFLESGSDFDQNIGEQLDSTTLDKVFTDKITGNIKECSQLTTILNYVRDGDMLMAYGPDRLVRNF